MRSRHFLCIYALLAWAPYLVAQEFELKGRIKDQDGGEVSFATVYLYKASDTTLVRTDMSDESGVFRFPGVEPQVYFLRASYVEQYSDFRAIDVSADTDAGVLTVSLENALEEVEVVGKLPAIRREPGKVVFKVENTILSTGTTADILGRAPGVVDDNGSFYLRGQPAKIYINGRPLPLSSSEVEALLEGFSGANVESVEVIANPGAQYSAESGAILNIITSKNITPGYKGSVQASYTQAVVAKYQFGLSQYFKSEKLDVFLGYSFSPQNNFIRFDATTLFNPQSSPRQLWAIDGNTNNRRRNSNLNGLLQYEMGENSTLEYAFNLQVDPARSARSTYLNDITDPDATGDALLSGFNTLSELDGDLFSFSNDIAYKYQGETTSLTWNTNYTRFDGDDLQRLRTDYFDENRAPERSTSFDTRTDQIVDILTSQVDFSKGLGESSLDAGARISYVESDNAIDYESVNGTTSIDEGDSDTFTYFERVYAAYVNFVEGGWEKWALTSGLRMEHTNLQGYSRRVGEATRLDFTEWFPSAQLLFQPGDKFSMSFDYRRGIERPNYRLLNPFRLFVTEVNFLDGNPQIQPSFNNNYTLNFTFQDQYFLDFYFYDNGRYISSLVFQENDTFLTREQYQNVIDSRSYGIDFTVSRGITNWWYLYSYASLFHEEETFIAEESGGVEFTNEIDGFFVQVRNYLTLSQEAGLNAEVSFDHLSGFISGSYQSEARSNLTVGLSKDLWDNRANFSIQAEDLLNTANFRRSSVYLNQNNNYLYFTERQLVRFSFRYNFGNFRLRSREPRISSDELDRLGSKE